MRIALVANTAWNLYNFRRGLLVALQNEGHELLCLAPQDDYVEPLRKATGCRFRALQKLSRKGTNPLADWACYRELKALYKEEGIELAMHYTIKPNIYGSLAAAALGIDAWATVTGLGYSFLSKGPVHYVVKFLYRRAFARAKRVFFQNEDDKQLFEELGLYGAAKGALIHGSGIASERFAPRPKPESKAPFRFLFVGRLLYDKGVAELLEAAALVKQRQPELEICLVGSFDKGNPSMIDEALLARSIEAGHVQFLGPSDDIPSQIASADALVLPSYREGLPRVLLEAMSMAKPIITSDAPGCRALVREGKNGFQVSIKNAQALAQAMLRMYRLAPEERQAFGKYSRAWVLESFDERVIVGEYLKYLAADYPEHAKL